MASARRLRGLAASAVGFAVTAVFVVLATRGLDVARVTETWHRAVLLPWLPLAMLSYVLGHVVRGMRLRVLLGREVKIPLSTATNIVVIGYAFNNVLPARLGELVRSGMTAERAGVPYSQALTITIIERMLDGLAIVFLLTVASIYAPTAGWIHQLVRGGAVLFVVALCGVFFAALAPHLFVHTASRLTSGRPRAHDVLVGIVSQVVAAAAPFRRPREIFRLFVLSIVVWLFESGLFALALPAFGLAPSYEKGVVAMGVTNLGILFPSTPGFVGPFHYFCMRAMVSQGVPEARALGIAVFAHLAFYAPVTIWGAVAISRYGVEVGRVLAAARAARAGTRAAIVHSVPVTMLMQVSTEKESLPSSPLLTAIVKALLPGPDDARADAASLFVRHQLGALSSRLRAAVGLGLFGFRLAVRARYVRGFCDLPRATQRRIVEAWAYGPVSLARRLFRPIRALALFAYYEPERRAPLQVPSEAAASGRARASAKLVALRAVDEHG